MFCKICKKEFKVDELDTEFLKKFSEEHEGLCFDCSQKRKLCFRNERVLYKRKCDFTGEEIISVFSPDSPHKVYKSDIWYSDKWNPLDYGRDYDFSRGFFEQFAELKLAVPRIALFNIKAVNSDYCNMAYSNKNCYLIFGSDFNEDCMYCTLSNNCVDTVDTDYSEKIELGYEVGDSGFCYGCQYTFFSKNCADCYYLYDCIGCHDCILCYDLANKSYCIENKQHTKEEYLKRKNEIISGSYQKRQELWQNFRRFLLNGIFKFAHTVRCIDCTGDYIYDSKNCHNCYDMEAGEDMKDIIFANKSRDCFQCSLLGHDTEFCYNTISTLRVFNIKFSFGVVDSNDVEYSDFVEGSKNIFGCASINHQEYCILNKKYSEDDFFYLRDKIIEQMKQRGEWGRFLSPGLSSFGYNETTAHDYFPLKKEEAIAQGFNWRDEDPRQYQKSNYQIPDNIQDVPDSVVNEIFSCSQCGRNYKIIRQELEFYRQQNLPIPRQCSDCRHLERSILRNPRKLWHRECICRNMDHGHTARCENEFETTYSPDRPEKVYCEECYRKEIY